MIDKNKLMMKDKWKYLIEDYPAWTQEEIEIMNYAVKLTWKLLKEEGIKNAVSEPEPAQRVR